MTDKHTQSEADQSNMQKDPQDWVTGDEAMTGAQKSYLKTLSEEAGEDFDETLTKAQASERIDELQQRTGRGSPGGSGGTHAHGGGSHAGSRGAPKQDRQPAQGRRH